MQAHTHTHTHIHQSFLLCAAVTPTISRVTNGNVDLSPTLVTGDTLILICTAMGTPRPQVNWYKGDSRIISNSRTQIIETVVDYSTPISILVISSATTGDSGAYQCRVENVAGTTSLQYQVTVSKYICSLLVLLLLWFGLMCTWLYCSSCSACCVLPS